MARKAARKAAAAATNQQNVLLFRKNIIKKLVNALRNSTDLAVLQELKNVWEGKLAAKEAFEPAPPPASSTTSRAAAGSGPAHRASPPKVEVLVSLKMGGHLTILAPDPPSVGTTSWPVTSTKGNAKSPPIKIVPLKSVPTEAEAGEKRIPISILRRCLQDPAAAEKLGILLHSRTSKSVIAKPVEISTVWLQQHIITAFHKYDERNKKMPQVDGAYDESTDEEEDELEEEEEEEEEEEPSVKKLKIDDEDEDGDGEEELNADDYAPDEDSALLEDTNVVLICQFKVINKKGETWLFRLKDGILNINGQDFIFETAETLKVIIPKKKKIQLLPDVKIYRQTCIGMTLSDTLNELVDGNRLSLEQAGQVLNKFDRIIFSGFTKHGVTNKLTLKLGNVNEFHRCKGLATIFMSDVEFLEKGKGVPQVSVDQLKIVSTKKPDAVKNK